MYKANGVDSVVLFKRIPIEIFYPMEYFILLDSNPIQGYENGKVTDDVIGYSYACVDPMNYNHLMIKVKGGSKPILDREEIHRRRESGEKIYVTFDNAVVTPYVDTNSKILKDSFSADDIHRVNIPADEIV